MKEYIRITGYDEKQDMSFVMDNYGYFDQLWGAVLSICAKGDENYCRRLVRQVCRRKYTTYCL